MDSDEREILEMLDIAVREEHVQLYLADVARCIEEKLENDPGSVMAWEPIPLSLYTKKLPREIRSSWAFIFKKKDGFPFRQMSGTREW